jgi:hypothetical protein
MRATIPLLLVGALGCATPQAETPKPGPTTYRSYHTWDATTVQSTLVEHAEPTARTLRGHTQLEDGAWLMEQATLDLEGRLIRAELDRGGPCDAHPTHIVFDRKQGVVEINSAGKYTRWNVPNDLPWVPTGLMRAESSGRDVSTPVAMTIALRSARAERAARLVDVRRLTSATIMSDQLFDGGAEPTVVLGDDYAEIEGELPVRIHLAALNHDLDAHDPDLTAAWARARCQNQEEGTAL